MSQRPAPRGPVPRSCVITSAWIGSRLQEGQAAGTVILFSWLIGERWRPSPVLFAFFQGNVFSIQAVFGRQRIPPTPFTALPDAYRKHIYCMFLPLHIRNSLQMHKCSLTPLQFTRLYISKLILRNFSALQKPRGKGCSLHVLVHSSHSWRQSCFKFRAWVTGDRHDRSGVKAKLPPQNLSTEVLMMLEVLQNTKVESCQAVKLHSRLGEEMITGNYASKNALWGVSV